MTIALCHAKLNHQLQVVFRIIVVTGVIYGLGSIISVFIGPIYPHQVIAHARLWEGKWLQQGVGFGTNQNAVGGILLFFLSIALFCWQNTTFKKLTVIFLLCIAIVSTMSRSILISSFITTICLIYVFAHSLTLKQKINARNLMIWLAASIIIIIAIISIPINENNYWKWMAEEGFGKGDLNRILEGGSGRISLWQKGMDVWVESGAVHTILGQGMKGSSAFTQVAWRSPHNLYISFLGDFGILGLVIFLLVMLFYLIRSIMLF